VRNLTLNLLTTLPDHTVSSIEATPAWRDPKKKTAGMRQILSQYEAIDLSQHPLFIDLARQDADLASMWAIVHTFREDISKHLVRWLSGALHRSSLEVQCILVDMLYDELGRGNADEAHSVLLDRWYHALTPWRLHGDEDQLLSPGRRLALQLEGYFGNPDVDVSLAAIMVAEVFAEKFDKCLLTEVRRSSGLSKHDLEWLILHCQVEEAHAAAAVELARLIEATRPNDEQLRLAAAGTWRVFSGYLLEVRKLLRHSLWQTPTSIGLGD